MYQNGEMKIRLKQIIIILIMKISATLYLKLEIMFNKQIQLEAEVTIGQLSSDFNNQSNPKIPPSMNLATIGPPNQSGFSSKA